MAVVFALALVGAAAAAYAAYVHARARYLNYWAGAAYREWLITHGGAILADPDAAPAAKSAARLMLQCAFDEELLLSLATELPSPSAGGAGADAAFDKHDWGRHGGVVKDSIDHLAVLSMLANERRGNAFRALIDGEGNGCSPESGRITEQFSMSDVMDGLTKLPSGKTAARFLAGNLLARAA